MSKRSPQRSLDRLDDGVFKPQTRVIVGGHPVVFKSEDGVVKISPQREAFSAALKVRERNGGKIVIRISNPGYSHKDFLKEGVSTGRSVYPLSELSDFITDDYEKEIELFEVNRGGDRYKESDKPGSKPELIHKSKITLSDIQVIFQTQANGYIKQYLNKHKPRLWQILVQEKDPYDEIIHDDEYFVMEEELSSTLKTNCKGTIVGFIKLSSKIEKGADSLLLCLGSDPRCADLDVQGGVQASKDILGLDTETKYAYFDSGTKPIPIAKCGGVTGSSCHIH